MPKLIRILTGAFTYFCVATVITLAIGLYMFWSKGGLAGNRTPQLLAVLHGLDIYEFWKQSEAASRQDPSEQAPYEDVVEGRLKASLDIDLREHAVRRGIAEMKQFESQVRDQRREFEQIRQTFVAELARREQETTRVAMQELQDTMIALSPKQAKEQILLWLENPKKEYPFPGRDVNADMVTLIKGMATDRQAKLFKEFKNQKEAKLLNEILEQIRRGDQEDLLRDTKNKLDETAGIQPKSKR